MSRLASGTYLAVWPRQAAAATAASAMQHLARVRELGIPAARGPPSARYAPRSDAPSCISVGPQGSHVTTAAPPRRDFSRGASDQKSGKWRRVPLGYASLADPRAEELFWIRVQCGTTTRGRARHRHGARPLGQAGRFGAWRGHASWGREFVPRASGEGMRLRTGVADGLGGQEGQGSCAPGSYLVRYNLVSRRPGASGT